AGANCHHRSAGAVERSRFGRRPEADGQRLSCGRGGSPARRTGNAATRSEGGGIQMKPMTAAVLAAAAAVAVTAAARDDDWRNWQFQDRDTVQRTFSLTGSDQPKLLVDNMIGYVHVTAAPGREMKVTVQKHAYGRSQAALDDSKREVKLDL